MGSHQSLPCPGLRGGPTLRGSSSLSLDPLLLSVDGPALGLPEPLISDSISFLILFASSPTCFKALRKKENKHLKNYMGHVMRKTVYAIPKQQRRRSACASMQSDQCLLCSLSR